MYFCGLLIHSSAVPGGKGSGCTPGAPGVPAGRQAEGRQACLWRNRGIPAQDGSPSSNTTLRKAHQVRKLRLG